MEKITNKIVGLVSSIRPLRSGEFIEHPAEETVDWIRRELLALLSEDDLRKAAQVVYMDNNLHIGVCPFHRDGDIDTPPTYDQVVMAIRGVGSRPMIAQWTNSAGIREEIHFAVDEAKVITGRVVAGWSPADSDTKRFRAARGLSLKNSGTSEG